VKIILITAALLLMLAACGGEPEPHELLGRWRHESEPVSGPIVRDRVTFTIYEFLADGTGLFITQSSYYEAPEMELIENEDVINFIWNTENGGLTVRMYYGSFDMDDSPGAAYEILTDDEGAEFLWFDSEWVDEDGLPELFERISGEPGGGLYGKWLRETESEDALRSFTMHSVSYEFFEDGTARYHSWQLIEYDPPMRPIEYDTHFIWRETNGYLAMIMYGEQDYEYLINGDTLTISMEDIEMFELTRLIDSEE